MKIFRYISLLLIGLALSQAAAAQTILTGVVTDKSTGAPLIGANVHINNASNRSVAGATALVGGEYRIVIPSNINTEGLKIIFSFIGYKTVEIEYTGQRSVNFALESDVTKIEKVVIETRAARLDQMGIPDSESIASTDRMSLEHLETAPVTNIVEALQGALANVDVLTGADPGSKSSIRIRGTTTFNTNAEPLIVLDGIPFPVDIDQSFDFATATEEDYAQILNIPPSDMEQIEILKDAAGTALYGSRGANGVILITRKKGAKGKVSVSFNSTFEVSKEPKMIPLLNGDQYVSLMQDAIWNTVNTLGPSQDLLNLLYNTPAIGYDPQWKYFNEYNQNTDWVDQITRTAYKTDNNVTVSGGGDKTTYRLSVGYLKDVGTMKGAEFNRFNTSFAMGYRFSDKLRIEATYSLTKGERDAPYHNNERSEAINKMPNLSPYRISPNGSWSDEYFTPYETIQGKYTGKANYNPVASVNEGLNRSNQMTNDVRFMLEYYISPELKFISTASAKMSTSKARSYLPVTITGVTWSDANYNRSADNYSDQFYLFTENKLQYNKSFNGSVHRIIATARWTTSEQDKFNYGSAVSGNASSSMIDPVSGGIVQSASSGRDKVRSVNGSLSVHYTLYDKYIINGGYNIEANSAMGENNRWGTFPVIGVAWKLQEEAFMEPLRGWLDESKLRVSYGISGSAPSGTGAYLGAFKATGGKYIEMNAIEPLRIQLDNLKYQKVSDLTTGLDFAFMNYRLTGSFDFYQKKTRNMLQKDVKLPSSTGYGTVKWYNSGKMQNRGWEFSANYRIIEQRDLRLSVRFNMSQNESKVKELPSNLDNESYTFGNGNYASKVVVGDPLGSFYGHEYHGVYGSVEETYVKDASGNVVNNIYGNPVIMTNNGQRVFPGDAKYRDVNGDGNIDQYDIVYLGNSQPRLTGGLTTDLSYKGWGLVMQFQGRYGQKVINQTRINMESMRGTGNQSAKVLERWRNPGDELYTEIPRALYNYGYNYLGSDRFVEDASFFRLKYVTLKYNLPREVLNRLKMNQLQVYVTGYDLWTITGYKGQDPEVGTPGGMYPIAKDNSMTPKGVRVAAGLRVTF